jgi:hypothetical protein
MVKGYESFLFRWWRLEDGHQRIEIVHIQSGDRTVLEAVSDALSWLEWRSTANGGERVPPRFPTSPPASPEGGNDPGARS